MGVFQTEQTSCFLEPTIAKYCKQTHWPETWRRNLKLRHNLFFLAAVLIATTPVFADTIRVNPAFGDRDSDPVHGSPTIHLAPLAFRFTGDSLENFKEDEARIASNLMPSPSELWKDDKTSDLFRRTDFGRGQDGADEGWVGLDSIHSDSFDKNDDDRLCAVVATPEPGSGTLLLFGVVVMGIIMGFPWLRNHRS
jgi:hypothetical protein